MTFSGAKIAVFLGDRLLVLKRDRRPGIPFPGFWDLPGDGREGEETPVSCALRETFEEVGLTINEKTLVWSATTVRPEGVSWFFVTHLPRTCIGEIQFGDEGVGWSLMSPTEYCSDPLAISHLAKHLETYLFERVTDGG